MCIVSTVNKVDSNFDIRDFPPDIEVKCAFIGLKLTFCFSKNQAKNKRNIIDEKLNIFCII